MPTFSISRSAVTVLTAWAATGCGGSPTVEFDLLILGGTVIDGTGAASTPADVGIVGDRIVWISTDAPQAFDTLNATGLVVSPGFIDVHSHTIPALIDPERRFNEGVVRQGVTTVVGGPDGGFGPAQIRALTEAIESAGAGTNVAFYVGHNAIRRETMGSDQRRAPNPEELDAMRAMVRDGMELGAVGLSTGLMYEPGMFSETAEVIELAREVAPFGGIYDSHVRNPVHALLESDEEVITIAEGAGIGGKLGHLKAVGLHNEGVSAAVIDLVEEARSRGADIVADQYPYDGAATSPLAGILVIPPDVPGLEALRPLLAERPLTDEGRSVLRGVIADASLLVLLREASENGVDGGFAWLNATGYSSMRVVSSPDYPELVGRYLSELAEERGEQPFDVVLDLIAAASDPVNITLGAIEEDDVRAIMTQPWTMIASDGAYVDGSDSSQGHPRSAGTFARLLGHYVREEGVLPLGEAVRKITSLPADFLGLSDRGRLQVGAAADLAVFDPWTIIDRSDWDHPNRFAEGVVHVLVNGTPVLRDGRMTGVAPGRVLRPASGT